jgi:nitrite reductase/ring-hydroxylating ferredoxin subunit
VASTARLICASGALQDSDTGVRFDVELDGDLVPAFAVRFAGRVVGYLNRCAHVALELDWSEGVFFDEDGRDLICSAHGAVYAAASGQCLGGPCDGKPLVRLRMEERDGSVYYLGVADGG